MPSAGYSHFYRFSDLFGSHTVGVSMPSAGYSHFYKATVQIREAYTGRVCQCPRRAILISTYIDYGYVLF